MILDKRVLLIEDNDDIRQSVSALLSEMGFYVSEESNGRKGLYTALHEEFDLIVLDLGLPELNGMEVCRLLRPQKPHLPILILTAEPGEATMVLGLELGADEFINKPFSAIALKARIRTLLRRVEALDGVAATLRESLSAEENYCGFGNLRMSILEREAWLGGMPLELTPTEFEILTVLCQNAQRFLNTEALFELVWQDSAVYEVNIRTHITNLRAKLLAAGTTAPTIANKRGFGYRLVDTAK